MAKPTKYTRELLDRICDRLAQGIPLTRICADLAGEGIELAPRTVRDWEANRPAAAAAISAAREAGEYALAEECLEIADDARNDWMALLEDKEPDPVAAVAAADSGEDVPPKAEDPGIAGYRFNGEHVQRSKLRIETRMKLLAKFNPKRWGEKVSQEISGPGGGPVETVTVVERRIVRPGSTDR